MNADDLSHEQQIVRAIVARTYGDEIADQVVRDDRVTSYLFGAYLAPVLGDIAVVAQHLVNKFAEIERTTHEDPDAS